MDETTKRNIDRFTGARHELVDDILATEQQVTITVNSDEVIASACSPEMLRELTYGHLLSEGMIRSISDVNSYHEVEGAIDVEIHSLERSRDLAPIESAFSVSLDEVLEAASKANQRGRLFQLTGGAHAAAICATAGDMTFVEDISRTCALEKAIGMAFLSRVDLTERFVFLSSRIPSNMVKKIARCGIPMIGGVSAPTAQAVDLADKLGICLCGFVRGRRINIYSHKERIVA